MTIGAKIQILRKQKGLSQEQLAEELGVSRQAVSKWEAEQSIPDIDKIIVLSDFFGVTTDYILRNTDEPQPQSEIASVYTYNNTGEIEEKIDNMEKRKKSALLLAIAVMLYILSIVPPILIYDDMGPVLMFIMIAIATGIIVYRAILNSKDKKEENEPKNSENPVLKAVKSGVWAVAVVIYIMFSFRTQAWHITWLVFPITSAIVNVIEACFDLKDGENK